MVWVNLLPWRRAELKKRWSFWRLIVGGLLLILIAGLCCGQCQRWLNQQHVTTLALWNTALKSAVALWGQMQSASQQSTRLQRQLEQQQRRQRQWDLWLSFARTLGHDFPADVWLYTLRKTPLGLEVQGATRRIGALHQLRDGLRASPLFDAVRLQQVERVKRGEMTFTLQARLVVSGMPNDE
ncbi:PilN domain-containing protein [Erwinia tasmaniensis]|uniref:Predicted fimbrial assembly protein n=1 Tax=Erwinia tasmaniensis (strain DSM 17950 / CFBP 7177 / CIP 109463 / NCPPB 4357 / Et1/99) TaxID=465817 RepID=B2VJX2_ERWT9|nr:PilN domain-containing protein [Erwinia tasmaniensis]CAO98256.1 Predicted fimbrial assembly protein [Erwinia tasmaniensis Et1/99]